MSILKANRIENLTTTDGGINVNNSGQVGVGTSSPGANLEVRGSSSNGQIRVGGSTSGTYSQIYSDNDGVFILNADQGNNAANSYLGFNVDNSERLRIDSLGNVAIGTTSIDRQFHVQGGGVSGTQVQIEGTVDSAGIKFVPASGGDQYEIQATNSSALVFYNRTDAAERMQIDSSGNVKIASEHLRIDSSGKGIIFGTDGGTNRPSIIGNYTSSSDNNIVFNVTGSERMRLDSSGRLFVGTTSQLISGAEKKLQMTHAGAGAEIVLGRDDSSVASGNSLGAIKFVGNDGGTYQQCAKIEAIADGTHANNDKPSRLVFSTTADNASSPTERMRIANSGLSDIFGTSSVMRFRTGLTGTSGQLLGGFNGATSISNGTQSLAIFANGNIQNTNNSYGSLSDSKLKENIVDANSQWDDIKDIRVRNYNFIEGETHTQLGVVAQEVETVSPGLVTDSPDLDEEGNDLGTVTKSVNYSVLYMKAVKALQEAQTRIEALETQNTAQQTQINDLLSRVTALETAS